MPTENERFFEHASFAVVGHTAKRSFPKLSYGNLRRAGKKVFPVDLAGTSEVEGDRAVASLADLPEPVEAVISEVPKEHTLEVLTQAEQAGIRHAWLHMGTDTPEALAFCKDKGIKVHHGTCAVMYTEPGFSFHAIHKWIMKLAGKY